METLNPQNAPSVHTYIVNLAKKANDAFDNMHRYQIRQKRLSEEVDTLRQEKKRKSNLLDYIQDLHGTTQTISLKLKEELTFFSLVDSVAPSPAHQDLKPEEETLKVLLANCAAIAKDIYQSILISNYCLGKLHQTSIAISRPTENDSPTPPGYLHYDSGVDTGLLAMIKQAMNTGTALMEKLGNIYLSFLRFIYRLESIYLESMDVSKELKKCMANIKLFLSRTETRISSESNMVKKIERDLNKTEDQLKTVSQSLKEATVDHAMLKAEYNAARSSIEDLPLTAKIKS